MECMEDIRRSYTSPTLSEVPKVFEACEAALQIWNEFTLKHTRHGLDTEYELY
jgi:hypothetical protein